MGIRRACLLRCLGIHGGLFETPEKPLRYQRALGLDAEQLEELHARVKAILRGVPARYRGGRAGDEGTPGAGRWHVVACWSWEPARELWAGNIARPAMEGSLSAMNTDRELYVREHEYNAQVGSIRAPIERAVLHLKTWKILFTDYRRPLCTFSDSFRAVISLYFFELSFR
jgi:hypothetical protein